MATSCDRHHDTTRPDACPGGVRASRYETFTSRARARWHPRPMLDTARNAVLAALVMTVCALRGDPAHAARRVEPGLYEGIDPRDGLPGARIDAAAPDATRYVEWLAVERSDRVERGVATTTYAVVFMPEGRVRWDLDVDARGLVAKVTSVDGVVVHRSAFDYDANGLLVGKRVAFASGDPAGGLAWTYEAMPGGGRARVRVGGGRDQELVARADGAFELRTLGADGAAVRVDRYDVHGRRASIELAGPAGRASVRFQRNARGAIVALARRGLAPDGVLPLDALPDDSSRADAWRVFGPPPHTSDEGQGGARRVSDTWSKDYWLNRTSTLRFTPDLALEGKHTSCICGLCVAVESGVSAIDIEAVDTHLSDGPWVAIDGALLTEDHLVATPGAPIRAGDVAVGDLVLGADGAPRAVAAVEHLGRSPRPAINLRTASGTFVVGDLTVMSEL
ncbi:MAG: hypothetical protein U1F43_36825 [Myxococcota bacterium]